MKKIKQISAICASAVLAGVMSFAPVTFVRAEADDEITSLQKGILDWEIENNGGKTLISGSILEGAGTDTSDWSVFGYARSGYTDGLGEYLTEMQEMTAEIYEKIEAGDTLGITPSALCRLAIVSRALGADPENFGQDKDGNPINLVKDAAYDCILGDVGQQGNNGYIWALLTLDSADYEIPADAAETRESLVEKLLNMQNEDGGFGLTGTDDSDIDLTAMALTALAPYENEETVSAAADKAFSWLLSLQQDDGTVSLSYGRSSESLDWVIIACECWGKDLNTEFVKNGCTLLDALKLFCLDDGGIIHSLDSEEPETEGNVIAGNQTYYALEAVRRAENGEPTLFDLSDAPTTEMKQASSGGISAGMIAGIAAAVAAVIVVALIISGKKKSSAVSKNSGQKEKKPMHGKPDWGDDDNDDW